MIGKFVANRIGEVINQRDIAKDITLTPINAMSLKGIKSIGCKDDNMTAGANCSIGFLDGLIVIIDMLYHLMQKGHIERVICKRQNFGCRNRNIFRNIAAVKGPTELNFRAEN